MQRKDSFVRFSAVIAFVCAIGSAHAAAAPVAQWNLLFFLNGKNDLQQEMQDFVLKNLYTLKGLNLPENVNILVEYGTSEKICDPASRADRHLDLCRTGVKRFRMIKGLDQVNEPDSAFEFLGKVDMGDVGSLVDFAKWSRQFPARHTLLYIFDHGADYRSSDEGLFSFDAESGHSMNAREISDGFWGMARTLGKPIDLFVTDMCSVGSAEALASMEGSLKYYVASREEVYSSAVNVLDILGVLERFPDINAKRYAYQIVLQANHYAKKVNFSAFDLGVIPRFETSLADVIERLKASSAADRLAFQTHFLKDCRFPVIGAQDGFEFRDVLTCMGSMPGMRDWPEYRNLRRDFFAMMYTNASDMNLSGLSIWGGTYRSASAKPEVLADYRKLRFDEYSHWSDLIELLGQGRSPDMGSLER